MSKLARANVKESVKKSFPDTSVNKDEIWLKKQKEDEIRVKLAKFAEELSLANERRKKH